MSPRNRCLRTAALGLMLAGSACSLTPQAATPSRPASTSTSPAVEALPDPQRDAYEALAAASSSPPLLNLANGFPRSVTAHTSLVGDTPAEQALSFLETYRDLYLLRSPDLELGVEDVHDGPLTGAELAEAFKASDTLEMTADVVPDAPPQFSTEVRVDSELTVQIGL